MNRPPLRHELKFQISYSEYIALSRKLDLVLDRDPGGDEYNEYAIRSLYFDTYADDFLYEKLDGVGMRKKYRLRIYRFSDKDIKLECKSKYGSLISKQGLLIPRDLAEQLIACDPTGLENTAEPLLQEMYKEMRMRLLHPVVIVDYVREAYIHVAEDVRITFDKKLHTGLRSIDLFNPRIPTIPAMDENLMILEVKYNRVLPNYIRDLLTGVSADYVAASKYVMCRQFEEKEF